MSDLRLMIVDDNVKEEENIDLNTQTQHTTNITITNDFSNVTSVSNTTTSGMGFSRLSQGLTVINFDMAYCLGLC